MFKVVCYIWLIPIVKNEWGMKILFELSIIYKKVLWHHISMVVFKSSIKKLTLMHVIGGFKDFFKFWLFVTLCKA
jgi:hypothetical protein